MHSTPSPVRCNLEDARQAERGGAMGDLVLSLFLGIGLLDRAFEEAGFCVVRGPDVLWGGDVKRFHPPTGKFDGVIGGPPCKAFSRLVHIIRHNGYTVAENLIPEYERCVSEAQPAWFVMENVPDAPLPKVGGYFISRIVLNNRWFGSDQNRERSFCFGNRLNEIDLWRYLQVEALESSIWLPAVTTKGQIQPVKRNGGGNPKKRLTTERLSIDEMLRRQGLPGDWLDEAPFSIEGKRTVIGNGVPLPMGRAIANAVREALAVLGAAGG